MSPRSSRTHFDQKKQYLVTLALVSSRRKGWLRAQTSIFTIENQHFLIQMAPQPSWPPSLPADCLQARSPQPGVLSQESSARNPQPGILSRQSPANLFGVRAGVIPDVWIPTLADSWIPIFIHIFMLPVELQQACNGIFNEFLAGKSARVVAMWLQQRFLARYLIPGCIGRGIRLGSGSLSSPAGRQHLKSGIFPLWD